MPSFVICTQLTEYFSTDSTWRSHLSLKILVRLKTHTKRGRVEYTITSDNNFLPIIYNICRGPTRGNIIYVQLIQDDQMLKQQSCIKENIHVLLLWRSHHQEGRVAFDIYDVTPCWTSAYIIGNKLVSDVIVYSREGCIIFN
jgi:hypothetical protein